MKKTTKPKKVEVVEAPVISLHHLGVSFGQEDLNKVVDKINEIITHLNNVV